MSTRKLCLLFGLTALGLLFGAVGGLIQGRKIRDLEAHTDTLSKLYAGSGARIASLETRLTSLNATHSILRGEFDDHVRGSGGRRRGVGESGTSAYEATGPRVDVWLPTSIDEPDPDPELQPLTEDEFEQLQREMREFEANRPRIVTKATPADVQKTLEQWGRALFERDMGLSVVDGKGLPVYAKIDGILGTEDRVRDLEAEFRSFERRVAPRPN
ncbi:hypothetical protein Pan44_26840 [Caulifigura coniformis]|uniref:Uncharacterized protein n=1 Tax=Caulifigura coniformis TaxID=2527983 RepID=A0A517SEU9_9PLAN|nr:hypothetical protein [Caulifigura coniformis]QDT54649.1 hypothetical protein Pan44_26840 [Caulifigura coniformis]